jgi:hypothetical protein
MTNLRTWLMAILAALIIFSWQFGQHAAAEHKSVSPTRMTGVLPTLR